MPSVAHAKDLLLRKMRKLILTSHLTVVIDALTDAYQQNVFNRHVLAEYIVRIDDFSCIKMPMYIRSKLRKKDGGFSLENPSQKGLLSCNTLEKYFLLTQILGNKGLRNTRTPHAHI
jgi:hypothetical protein